MQFCFLASLTQLSLYLELGCMCQCPRPFRCVSRGPACMLHPPASRSLLACPEFHKIAPIMLLLCTGLCIYIRSHQKNFRVFRAIFLRGHQYLFLSNYTKENAQNTPKFTFLAITWLKLIESQRFQVWDATFSSLISLAYDMAIFVTI